MTSQDLYEAPGLPAQWWTDLTWPKPLKFLAFWPTLAAMLVLMFILIVPVFVLLAWEQ